MNTGLYVEITHSVTALLYQYHYDGPFRMITQVINMKETKPGALHTMHF